MPIYNFTVKGVHGNDVNLIVVVLESGSLNGQCGVKNAAGLPAA